MIRGRKQINLKDEEEVTLHKLCFTEAMCGTDF